MVNGTIFSDHIFVHVKCVSHGTVLSFDLSLQVIQNVTLI